MQCIGICEGSEKGIIIGKGANIYMRPLSIKRMKLYEQ